MKDSTPVHTDIVLIGGGHSHVAVLKSFGMKPIVGVRLTLVARDVETPYSGMLPGLMAGHYTRAQSHIDLQKLARFAGARLLHTSATGLDLTGQLVFTDARPPLPFDFLSVDVGSTPATTGIHGASEHAVAVKPVDAFLRSWQRIQSEAMALGRPATFAIVGGGAGGVELCLSLAHRLDNLDVPKAQFVIITQSEDVVLTHAPRVRALLRDALTKRGIEVRTGAPVVSISPSAVTLRGGEEVVVDYAILVTSASAPSWLADTGLALDSAGFVRVGETLRSVSHPNVFAVGDVASFDVNRLPKSGVFAVRQGPILSRNLRALATGRRVVPFRPQARTLALISTGDENAIASYGAFAWQGRWVWRWKDWIDRTWMRRYQELPEMAEAADEDDDASTAFAMRCGGCGSKVSSAVLKRVLSKLENVSHEDVVVGFEGGDDAAVLRVPPNKVLVQSVDHFRPFVDDPYLFGKITANHCLSDLYAMGATPQSAQAMVTIPFGRERNVEHDLFHLLSGALDVMRDAGVALVGGHTAEGPEMVFGLTVNGFADEAVLLSKGRMAVGDQLILTKPLGTGIIFAADMRAKAAGETVDAAVYSMAQPNRRAAEIFAARGVVACTDITGFGLLGHLVEMLNASGLGATLNLSSLPVLPAAEAFAEQNVLSSLDPANRAFSSQLEMSDASIDERSPRLSLLFDPQTSGGLLAAVRATEAKDCLAELVAAGYREASVIGRVDDTRPGQVALRFD